MIREKDKEEKAIDNINYKDAKEDMQKDNGVKVASADFSKMEMMDLKKLGYEMLFINNASSTNKGIPACICYYKAGIENGYKMRYGPKQFKKMDIEKLKIFI